MSEDFWSNDGAICPYCKHVNLPEDDNWHLYSEDTEEFTCTDCSKDFKVQPFARWSWTTEAMDEEEA